MVGFRAVSRVVAAAVLVAGMVTPSHAGWVWTRDGKFAEGEVRVTRDGLEVAQESGKTTRLASGEVISAQLREPVLSKPDGQLGGLSLAFLDKGANGGSAWLSQGRYVVEAASISKTDGDGGAFLNRGLFGDCVVSARLDEVRHSGVGAVMVRESLDAGAPFVALEAGESGTISLRVRPKRGEVPLVQRIGKAEWPAWLRLSVAEGMCKAELSKDGIVWEGAGAAVPVAEGLRGGIVLAGGDKDKSALLSAAEVEVRQINEPAAVNGGMTRYRHARAREMLPGVALADGTFLAGAELTFGDTAPVVTWRGRPCGGQNSLVVREFQKNRLSEALLAGIPAEAEGVLLASGDFYEGRVLAIGAQGIQLSSVLLGNKVVPWGEVQAVRRSVLREDPSGFALSQMDGSQTIAKTWPADEAGGKEIVAIRRSGPGVVGLESLPADLDGPGGSEAGWVTAFHATAGMWLKVKGRVAGECVVQPCGTTLSYTVPAGATMLLVRIGVPEAIPSWVKMRFVVRSGDREVYASGEKSRIDEVEAVRIPVTGGAAVKLKVETQSNVSAGMAGAWICPLFSGADAEASNKGSSFSN